MIEVKHLRYVTAPMVKQSDAPFRILTRKYDATVTYTQMFIAEKLLHDQKYLEYHLRDLRASTSDQLERPVVVQLGGNDPELLVQAARKVEHDCDGIGVFCYIRLVTNTAAIVGHLFDSRASFSCVLDRYKSWMPSRGRKGWALRRISTWPTGLAIG